MKKDTLIIQGIEYEPSAEQWELIRDAQKSFDVAFEQISYGQPHEQGMLDGGGDPYHEIGGEYVNRLREIMSVEE